MTRGSGLKAYQPAATDSLKSAAVDNPYGADLDSAIAKNQYYEFAITPLPGWKLFLKRLEFYAYFQKANGDDDPRGAGISYSTDGINFSTGIIASGKASSNPASKFAVSLYSKSLLQRTDSTVTFRIYLFGGTKGEFTGIGRAPGESGSRTGDDVILAGELR